MSDDNTQKQPAFTYQISPEDVHWTMNWRDEDGNKDPRFAHMPDTEEIYEPPGMLAVLAANDQIFIFPDKKTGYFRIFFNMNDVFAWACADAEEILFDELQDAYQHFERDPSWGPIIWSSKKRRMLPQAPMVERMRKDGIDVDALAGEIEELKVNDQKSKEAHDEKEILSN